MKKNLLLLTFWLLPLLMWAQAPAGYYTNADGKSGAELKTALFNIIKGHTSVSYDGLYTVYPTSDNLPGNVVWDMYSMKADGTANYYYTQGNKKCGSYSKEGDCYNREHSMPQSWFKEASPMVSDAFHVYPTDGKVNGMRSNYPFGEVLNASYTSSNGSMLGSSDPATGYTGTVFEPIDEFKGDFARTYFYMATCYEDKIGGWVGNGSAGEILDGTAYPVFKSWYVQLLLKWSRQDPVSQKEKDRNEAIYKIQHNRNPYIDNSDYAEYVWGGQTPSGVAISNVVATPELPTIANTVSVSATVKGTKTISVVTLKWGLTAALGNEITMNKTTGDVYQSATEIPAQALNATVYYAVFAQDVDGGSSLSASKSYTVGNSISISNIALSPTTPNETNSVVVSANVLSATALNSVKLFWGLTSTPTTEVAMSTTGSNVYTATIPAQAVGANVYYYISAQNSGGTTLSSTTASYTVANSIAPTNLISENFSSCIPSDWVAYSVASNKNWACVSNAQVEVNGYGADVASEDWLISKKLDASAFKNLVLSFKVKTRYTDTNYPNTLTVYYSTNYTGTGNPNTATWSKLTYTVPAANSNVFASSGNIDLTALEGKQFYISFKYVSTGTGSNSAALWGIDDVLVVGTPTASPTNQAPAITAVLHTPTSPTVGQSVTYSANVTDPDGTVKSVSLLYGEDITSLDQSAAMTLQSGNTYTTSLVFPNATTLYYKVEATDNLDLDATSDVITITAAVPANQAPVIASLQHTPATPAVGASVTYSASVIDADGTVKSVTLKYGTTEGVYDQSAAMALTAGSTYATTLAFPNTTKLYYRVEATDNLDLATVSAATTVTAAVPENQAPVVTNIQHMPTTPAVGENVTYSASVSDADGTVKSVTLKYGTTEGVFDQSAAMALTAGSTYATTFAFPNTTKLYYRVEATDNLDLATVSAATTVTAAVPENQAPVIASVQHSPSNPTVSQDVTFSASVTDADGTVKSVTLKYGTTEGVFDQSAAMALTAGSTYATTFAFPNTTKLYYRVEATDNLDLATVSAVTTVTAAVPANQAPVIASIQYSPTTPAVAEDVTYSASVTDADGTVKSVILKYGTAEGVFDQSAAMALTAGSTYATTFAFPNTEKLYFKIEATDNLDMLTISPVTSVTAAVPVNQAPVIASLQHTPATPAVGVSVTYSASVSDADGTVKSVTLKYGTIEGVFNQSAAMALTAGSTYATTFAFPNTTKLYYRVEATDNLDLATVSAATTVTAAVPENQTPVITGVQHTPSTPAVGASVTYSASVSDADGTVKSVILKYGTTEGVFDQSAAMVLTAGSTYATTFAFPNTTKLYYRVEATDNLDLATISAATTVTAAVPENQAPVVTNIQHTPTTPAAGENVTYSANATDADGTVKSVTLKYGTTEGVFDQSAAMALTAGSTYATTFAFPNTTKLYYRVEATDNLDLATVSAATTVTAAVPNKAPEINSIKANPESPQQGATVTISATATDSDGSIATVSILYGTSADNLSETQSMNLISGNTYNVAIVTPQSNALYFKIEASDNLGLKATSSLQLVYLTTGIGQVMSEEVNVFPNPAINEIKISIPNQMATKVQLFDLTGKLVLEIRRLSSGDAIDLTSLQSGIYMVRIVVGNSTITKKITISK